MSRQSKPPHSTPNPARRSPTAAEAMPNPAATAPTYEQIAVRAHEIFIARGAQHGRDQEDWYQAESELRLGKQ
jgi:hypothetical protein